jgi:protein-S-isoprenylcysteine O-methyltransferase Ste14
MRTLRLALVTALHTAAVPGSVVVGIPWLVLVLGDAARWPEPGPPFVVGCIVFAAAFALFGWCTITLVSRGSGTPNPLDPPRFLVARGPYRLVRNPMYIAVLGMVVGEAVAFASNALVICVVATWLSLVAFVRWYEEPRLRRRFGNAYEEYCREVPRWWPRVNWQAHRMR